MKDDAISRQAAYETLSEYYHHRTEVQHQGLREALDRVPSAEPVRKKGRWIKQIDESINAWWYECSVCGDYPLKNAFGYDSLSQFCPWCGAELSEGEESHEDIPEGTL